jgi:hypothetical protein
MLGQSHPFAQSLQQSHSQLQSGQSLQQSSEQHPPSLQQGAAAGAAVGLELLAIPAATTPAATSKPPNNLTNI